MRKVQTSPELSGAGFSADVAVDHFAPKPGFASEGTRQDMGAVEVPASSHGQTHSPSKHPMINRQFDCQVCVVCNGDDNNSQFW